MISTNVALSFDLLLNLVSQHKLVVRYLERRIIEAQPGNGGKFYQVLPPQRTLIGLCHFFIEFALIIQHVVLERCLLAQILFNLCKWVV